MNSRPSAMQQRFHQISLICQCYVLLFIFLTSQSASIALSSQICSHEVYIFLKLLKFVQANQVFEFLFSCCLHRQI